MCEVRPDLAAGAAASYQGQRSVIWASQHPSIQLQRSCGARKRDANHQPPTNPRISVVVVFLPGDNWMLSPSAFFLSPIANHQYRCRLHLPSTGSMVLQIGYPAAL